MVSAENVADYRYAGFWRRVLAFILDQVLLTIAGGVASIVLGIAILGLGAHGRRDVHDVISLFPFLWTWLYYALLESSPLQSTVGKMACGLIVTDIDGQRISFGRATGRYFAKILSAIIIGIGFFMAGWTRRKQALHDIICDTLVLKKQYTSARVALPDAA
jgi:uncharacterized RDD family membrane protein YckC